RRGERDRRHGSLRRALVVGVRRAVAAAGPALVTGEQQVDLEVLVLRGAALRDHREERDPVVHCGVVPSGDDRRQVERPELGRDLLVLALSRLHRQRRGILRVGEREVLARRERLVDLGLPEPVLPVDPVDEVDVLLGLGRAAASEGRGAPRAGGLFAATAGAVPLAVLPAVAVAVPLAVLSAAPMGPPAAVLATVTALRATAGRHDRGELGGSGVPGVED